MATLSIPIRRMQARDLTRDLDLTSPELVQLLELAAEVKRSPRDFQPRSAAGT